jgi:phytanoyl-CoA hydroxylase
LLLDKLRNRRFHSRFGGLWTDRKDAEAEADRRIARGQITPEQRALALQFIRDGYVILRGAVSPDLLDRVDGDLDRARRHPLMHLMGSYDVRYAHATASSWSRRDFRGVDFHVNSPAIRDSIFHPSIAGFLRMIFDEDPLANQTLLFQHGSQQRIHQDPAYVTMSSPLRMAASWIALEDIEEGCGELVFYPGSHRFRDFLFGGKHKAFDPERDGLDQHERFLRSLVEHAENRKIPLKPFLGKRGDALIWSADLAHGGAKVTRPGATRRSLVTHYNPLSVRPNFCRGEFSTIRAHGGGCHYASGYYRLRDAEDEEGFLKPFNGVNLTEWTNRAGAVLDVIARNGTEIRGGAGSLTVVARDDDPGFFLEPQQEIAGRPVALRCEIETPVDTVFQIFRWDADASNYSEEKSVRADLNRGFNRLELELGELGENKLLRIDPARCPGEFVIRNLEVKWLNGR